MKYAIAALGILGIIVMSVDVRKPYDRAAVSTAWIVAGDSTGTGVFISDRLILTASHVIEGKTSIRAHSPQFEGGLVVSSPDCYTKGMACVLLASDPVKDLALLRVEGKGRPIRLAPGEASPGDPLFAIGCGDGTSLFGFASGHVRQVRHAEYPRPNGEFSARVLDMSVSVNLGDSGGPVVDSRFELAGIVTGFDTAKNQTSLAVSASEIRSFIAGAGR